MNFDLDYDHIISLLKKNYPDKDDSFFDLVKTTPTTTVKVLRNLYKDEETLQEDKDFLTLQILNYCRECAKAVRDGKPLSDFTRVNAETVLRAAFCYTYEYGIWWRQISEELTKHFGFDKKFMDDDFSFCKTFAKSFFRIVTREDGGIISVGA